MRTAGRLIVPTWIVAAALLSAACATAGKLSRLQTGMPTTQVAASLGEPDSVRASTTDAQGATITIWEYGLYKSQDHANSGIKTYYWLWFRNGVLFRWGEAGDSTLDPADEDGTVRPPHLGAV